MLNIVIIWFILDIVAVLIVLDDYRRWYRHDDTALQEGMNATRILIDHSPPCA